MPDCLLIHAPKFQNRYRSIGNYTSLQLMAIGIFALADKIHRDGRSVRILHLGLENALDPRFRIADYLKAHPTRVVAISCQWHAQLHDSLRVARIVKEHDPAVYVVAGGLSATFFAEEILRDHPAVDAIIRGEGERPLVELVRHVTGGAPALGEIPNLAWRDAGGKPVFNAARYTATEEELNDLNFHAFEHLEHFEQYVRMPKIFSRLRLPPALKWRLSSLIAARGRLHYYSLPVGRGCDMNCAYCGGGNAAQRLLNERPRHIFRAPEKVLETILGLKRLGYQGAYVSFDPYSKGHAYYPALFRMMRERKIAFDFVFASWSLPSAEFVEEFARTFDANSSIYISPERGSEETRRICRGRFFGNEELLRTLGQMEQLGIRSRIFFSQGIPETREQYEETLRLAKLIRSRFKLSSVDSFSIEIEPGAPWYAEPEKFGICLTRTSLKDFLRDQRLPDYSTMYNLGYYPRIHRGVAVSSEREFATLALEEKCANFCDQRALCAAANLVWKTADLLHLSDSGDVPL